MSKYKFDLKTIRRRKKMTQVELAERSGVSQQAISFYEIGRSYPNLDNAKSIAVALGVTVDELITIKDAKERVALKLKKIIDSDEEE